MSCNIKAKMSQIYPYSIGYYNKDNKEDAAYQYRADAAINAL